MLYYIIPGLIYFLINIFIRKLHTKNESEDGWWLTILWVFGWPICFVTLLILGLQKLKKSYF